MPDPDPGDTFLHHRAVVLDALLSDPELGRTDIPEIEQPAFEEFDASEFPFPPPAFESPDSAPQERHRGDGPKASERILALLNGQTPNDTAAMDFSPRQSGAADRPEDATESPLSSPGGLRRASTRLSGGAGELLAGLRRPKLALAIGAGLVLVLILLLVFSGGRQQSAPTVLATATPSAVIANQTGVSPTAAAVGAMIEVRSAQSHCPPGGTPAMDAFAGPGKAWSCPRAFKVDGQVLTIDLGRTYRIESIAIVPGWDAVGSDGVDQWTKYRTASRVSYRFNDANPTTYVQQTMDQRTLVTTKIEPAVTASRIVVTVLASAGDPTINTTAVSSIAITGR